MKRVALTPQIEQHARRALGNDADLSNLHIYEAIALNTLPLRKRHPLYNGAVAEMSILREMAVALSAESRPVHIEHNSGIGMPLGRVFHGDVVDQGGQSELRVLFFLDASETEAISKVESGVVDQVSVSILPKHIYSSATGFDFLGPDADFDNVWNGTDDQGNRMNENGVFARMVGLDAWFEMSLVGQGGARNARIVRREESHFGSSYQKLAASGVDPNALVLSATPTVEDPMDLTAVINQLTDTKVELASANSAKTTLESQVATLTADKTALEARIAEMGEPAAAVVAKDAEIATLTADKTAAEASLASAVVALQSVATKLLTAAGKVGETAPSDIAELTALIDSTESSLAAVLVAGGRAIPADGGNDTTAAPAADLSAFKTSRK